MTNRVAYSMQQPPLAVARNKLFTITGFVVNIDIQIEYTKLILRVTNFGATSPYDEDFIVYFTDLHKKFIDMNVKVRDLIDAIGELKISKQSTDNLQVVKLHGKHAYIYRNFIHTYEEPKPNYVPADLLPDRDDLAY